MVIRIGMISFAHMHAQSYAACLTQLPDRVALAGLFDDDPERGKTMAQHWGVPFYPTCESLLEQQLNGVVICAENAKHRPYTELAARAGVHALCEKPISTSMADARAMIDICKTNKVQLMIAFPCRYSVPVFRARQIVREGRIGNVLAMRGTNRGTMPGGWFIDKKLSGGGAVIDHTVHAIDVWRWILGKEAISVYAEIDRLFYPDIRIEDTGLLAIEFEGGAFATLDTSWSRPAKAYPTWGDVTMEIVGDRGSIFVDAFGQRINVYNNKAVKAEWACWTDDIDLGLIKSFVKTIENGERSPITGFDGMKAMEVALGAYRSVQTGKPVPLPLKDDPQS